MKNRTSENPVSSNEEILELLSPVPQFNSRDEIKPWVHSKLAHKGVNLVIERSDSSKVVFKCKSLFRKPNQSKSSSSPSSMPGTPMTPLTPGTPSNPASASSSRRNSSLAEQTCPFRLRVSFSMKLQTWSVSIIKYEHNHKICSNFPKPIVRSLKSSTTVLTSSKADYPHNSNTNNHTTFSDFATPTSLISSPVSYLSTLPHLEIPTIGKNESNELDEINEMNELDGFDELDKDDPLQTLIKLEIESENAKNNPDQFKLDLTQEQFNLNLNTSIFSKNVSSSDATGANGDTENSTHGHSTIFNNFEANEIDFNDIEDENVFNHDDYTFQELQDLDKAMGMNDDDIDLLSAFYL